MQTAQQFFEDCLNEYGSGPSDRDYLYNSLPEGTRDNEEVSVLVVPNTGLLAHPYYDHVSPLPVSLPEDNFGIDCYFDSEAASPVIYRWWRVTEHGTLQAPVPLMTPWHPEISYIDERLIADERHAREITSAYTDPLKLPEGTFVFARLSEEFTAANTRS